MPPILLDVRPEEKRRLESVRTGGRYLSEHRDEIVEKHAGSWVVLREKKIVAADEDPVSAMRKAAAAGFDPRECLVEFIPKPGTSLFF